MKKYIVVFLAVLFLASCSNNIHDDFLGDPDVMDGNVYVQENENNNMQDDMNNNSGNGGSTGCQVHGIEYHSIPSSLVNYVGDSGAVAEWLASVTKNITDEGCPSSTANIYGFIEYFKIPKNIFIELYNEQTMRCDYPIDLLYSGTADEVDAYYRTFDSDKELEKIKWSNLNELKMDVVALICEKSGESLNFRKHSIIELMKIAEISPKELLAIEANKVVANSSESILETAFNYDMSILSEDTKSIESLISEHSVYYLDCMFCGIEPYETPYERQVYTTKDDSEIN